MAGVLVALFGLGALILSPFAFFQVITKAGYSGWWTFVPYTPWITGFLGAYVFRTVDTNRSIGSTFDELGLWYILTLLTGIFVMVMFFIFAFSAWPSLQQQQRVRPDRPTGFPPGGRWPPVTAPQPLPAMGVPSPTATVATATTAAPPGSPVAPGWYRSGPLGAGQQSYWDGTAWTARRRWSRGAWADMPLDEPAAEPGES